MPNRIPTSAAQAVATVVVLITAALPAQGSDGSPSPATRREFDKVRGIIGDRVILQSTIDSEIADRTEEQLEEAERRRLERDILREIARDEIWVQYGKVLGQQAPEAFEQAIEREVQKRIDALIQLYGSYTKANQELAEDGLSIAGRRAQIRKELLSTIAQQEAVVKRIRDQVPLLVTPREMLHYFENHPDEFAARTEADVAWVRFTPRETDEASRTHVTTAIEAWRLNDGTADDLAKRFGGVAMTIANIRPIEDDPRAEFLKQFAAAAAEGEISEPRQFGRFWGMLKLVRKVDQRERTFADQSVQDEIREQLATRRFDELNRQILFENAEQLFVWPNWLLSEG